MNKKCVIPAKHSSTKTDRVVVLREVTRSMQRKVASKYSFDSNKAGAQMALDMQDDMLCEALVSVDGQSFKFNSATGSIILNKTFTLKELTYLNNAFEQMNTLLEEDIKDFLVKMEEVEEEEAPAVELQPRKLA